MKKILITGGAGFIGKELIRKLHILGYKIFSYDKSEGKDILDIKELQKQIAKIDVVFHLAAVADLNWARLNQLETMEINIRGTYNIAHYCAMFGKPLYYASTCCIYGNQKKHPITEECFPNPTEIYAASKLAGEWIIKGYAKTYGLQYNNLRLATTYGPGMRKALGVYIFFHQAINGLPITVHGDGYQTRTLTYIDDLIDGMIKVFKSSRHGKDVNLNSEESISALDMAKKIKKLTKSKSPIIHISQRPGQIMREEISAQKAWSMFRWKAITSFDEGLVKTYQWFIQNK